MKLSIIIVNYNVTELLRSCLLSIRNYTNHVEYETLVVDNNSPNTSWKSLIDEFSEVKFISLDVNEGFASANNKGVAMAKGEYILLLNPDTEFEQEFLPEILAFADAQKKFGCLGIQMHDASGKFLPESKRSIPNMINSFEKLFVGIRRNRTKSYYRDDIAINEVAKVEVITGAFLLMRRSTYVEIGGLDEQYFMYGEDIDLCYTLLQNGYKNWYYGKFSILHHKGQSTIKDLRYLERFYGAMQIFINKYYKNQNRFQYNFLTAGLKLRYTLEKQNVKKKRLK